MMHNENQMDLGGASGFDDEDDFDDDFEAKLEAQENGE